MANNKKKNFSNRSKRKFEAKEPTINGQKVEKEHVSEPNDASWYSKSTQLLLDAGRLSFNVPLGSEIQWEPGQFVSTINNRYPDKYRLPGVMALSFIPTYGITNYANDPLNVASRNIYSWIRHANSGSRNYDPNDLMLYLMAMDNCYMMYQHMVRIYGMARVFSQLNRHLPDTLFEAIGINWNDIVANLSNFRAYINMISAKLGSLCVPSDMPIFTRHMWMCAGVYQDAPGPKSQMYIFKPSYLGIYDERTSTTGGSIKPIRIDNAVTTADLITRMDAMVNALVSSEDCGIISGDIRKAYGDKIISVTGIDDEYVVIPNYRIEVLRQIQNATIFNGVNIDSNGLIYQDLTDNILKSGVTTYVDSWIYGANRILTGSDEQPQPDEVLESTRLMVTGTLTVDSRAQSGGAASATNPHRLLFTPNAIGTEIISRAEIFGIKSTDTPSTSFNHPTIAYSKKYFVDLSSDPNKLGNYNIFNNAVAQVDNFNYHPRYGTLMSETINSNYDPIDQKQLSYQDVDNYCVVGQEVLFNVHNTALMSLFDIPVLGVK